MLLGFFIGLVVGMVLMSYIWRVVVEHEETKKELEAEGITFYSDSTE